jgi:hypothetical protein
LIGPQDRAVGQRMFGGAFLVMWQGGRSLAATVLMSVVIVVVIFVILDFDRPYRGLITVSQQSLIDLRHSMDLGLPLP